MSAEREEWVVVVERKNEEYAARCILGPFESEYDARSHPILDKYDERLYEFTPIRKQ